MERVFWTLLQLFSDRIARERCGRNASWIVMKQVFFVSRACLCVCVKIVWPVVSHQE